MTEATITLGAAVAERLLATLEARGVVFTTDGDRIRYDGPEGAIRTWELEAIREHKAEVLTLLNERSLPTRKVSSPSEASEASGIAAAGLPVTDPSDLVAALLESAEALWLAHDAGEEAAIGRCWGAYQQAACAYSDWSKALHLTDPARARDMDAQVAELLRPIESQEATR